MKRVIMGLLLLMCSVMTHLYGANVKGKIVDNRRQALDYVNVVLLTDGTNEAKYGGVSDVDGEFLIDDVAVGKYTIEISFIGFTTFSKKIEVVTAVQVLNLGSIKLSEVATMPGEVEVKGQASQMRFEIDKKVLNVE